MVFALTWGKQEQPARVPCCPWYRADMPVLEAISISSVGKITAALKVIGEDMTVEWWIALAKVATCQT